eukprot:4676263-Alexandrium_andersonii.AAC.1
MSRPTEGGMKALRLARYLREHPRYVQVFRRQRAQGELEAVVYTDWAGCVRARKKSTSGGMVKLGGPARKAWSSTQTAIGTSSGE